MIKFFLKLFLKLKIFFILYVIFFQIFLSQLDKYADNPWVANADKVIKSGSTYTEKDVLITMRDLLGDDECDILSYPGSLTNPDCNEVITWMVSRKLLSITSEQLSQLRRLIDLNGDRILQNFRPVQKRNGRKLRRYF